MQFSQKQLKEKIRQSLKLNRRVVIFTSDADKLPLERAILEETEQQAYWHIEVVQVRHYLFDLLHKNRQFAYQPLTRATALRACQAALALPDLQYFGGLACAPGLLQALLAAFEKMAEIDFNLGVPENGLMQEKWLELKRMYACFQAFKGPELMDAELYQISYPYLEKDVLYVDFTHQLYDPAYLAFLQQCHAERWDHDHFMPNDPYELALDQQFQKAAPKLLPELPLTLYEVQFPYQENTLVLQEITRCLLAGARYEQLIVYFPDQQSLENFVLQCPYPCRYEKETGQEHHLALLMTLLETLPNPAPEELAKCRKLMRITEDEFDQWLEAFLSGTTATRLEMLSTLADPGLLEEAFALPDGLSLADFCLLVSMLLRTPGLKKSEGRDRIALALYDQPILADHFQTAFLCGLNEGVYPAKITDKGLILNEELQFFEAAGTRLDHQNQEQWEQFKRILVTADHYIASCYYEGLDGTTYLPSLLFLHLLKLKGHKKATVYPLPDLPVKNEQLTFQPEPLAQALSDKIYRKQGKLQISPSELESFNQCPYQHFLAYGMKLRPQQSPLETRARFGTLMHHLLDDCSCLFGHDFETRLSALEQRYHVRAGANLDERLDQVVDALLVKEAFHCDNAEDRYLYARFKPQFLNTLKVLLYHIQEGQFELAYHEWPISAQYQDVRYVGRIDRADVYRDYLKIVDYKSSGKSLDLGLAIQGFNMQMLFYLELLSQKTHLKKGAVMYFNTSPKKIAAPGNMALDATSAQDFLKAHQMEGWLLEEDRHDVMYGLDQNYQDSQICHIRYVKSRDAYSGTLLNQTQWDALMKQIFNRVHEIVDACFKDGDIRIYPAGGKDQIMKMKVNPCRYCAYGDVCLRDPFYHEDRAIQSYTKEDVLHILEGGASDE